MTTEPDDSAPGILASVKRLLRGLVATAHNRFELLLVELQEERARLFGALLLAVAAVVCGLLTLVMLTVAILLAVGEEHRLLAAVGLTAAYLLATAILGWRLRVKLKDWPAFSATRAQLQKDREWLEDRHSKS